MSDNSKIIGSPRKRRFLIAILAALFVSNVACQQNESKHEPTVSAPPLELAVSMSRLQLHMDKLYFSIQAQNIPLAEFYVHELEEALAEVKEANLMEDGIALNPLIDTTVAPALENLERAMKSSSDPAAPITAYENVVGACNTCHEATKHGFIQIAVPSQPALTNQIFAPTKPHSNSVEKE